MTDFNEIKLEELLKANLAAAEESAKALEEMETQKELLLQQIDSGEAQLKALEEQLSSTNRFLLMPIDKVRMVCELLLLSMYLSNMCWYNLQLMYTRYDREYLSPKAPM